MTKTKTISLHMIIDGDYFTEKVRELFMQHQISKAHEWMNNLRPRPKKEYRKAILLGDAEFVGSSICDNPKCDQCKGLTHFRMIFKENLQYKVELEKHKKYIKTNYIEIDGDTIASKEKVRELVEKQTKVEKLKELRSKEEDPEIKDDRTLKSKIIDAEDDRDAQIEVFYQEHGVSKKLDYPVGSQEWKKKLEVDGLLEVIKAKSFGDKTVKELLDEAIFYGEKDGRNEINDRKRLQSFRSNEAEIQKIEEKRTKPSKDKIKVGEFSIPKNILNDYVESVKNMRRKMTMGMSWEDPLVGANALALRITQHRRIFETLKIPYHGDKNSTKKSKELYDVVEKYIEKMYPELTLGSVGRSLRRNFGTGTIKRKYGKKGSIRKGKKK